MEFQTTQTCVRENDSFEFANCFGDDGNDTQTRLNALLALNRETTRENSVYRNENERFEASLIKNPLTIEKAYSYFGAMLGLFPPFAIFSKVLFDSPNRQPEVIVVLLMLLMNVTCVIAGYFSGKLIGKFIAKVEKMSWSKMMLILPFIGILWGILTGAAGGVFVFIIGALFGAIIAGMAGGVAIPTFTIFHRLIKKGDLIEEKHFFPIALGITCTITAFILGL